MSGSSSSSSIVEGDDPPPELATDLLKKSTNKRYKYCVVPCCPNTTITAPDKIFVRTPKNPDIRKKWFNAMRRKHYPSLKPSSPQFCCEDHFDLESDAENYLRYKMMGGSLLLRKGVIPHRFECQKRSSSNNTVARSAVEKRRRLEYYERVLGPHVPESVAMQPIEFASTSESNNDMRFFDENEGNNYSKAKTTQTAVTQSVKNINSRGTASLSVSSKEVEKGDSTEIESDKIRDEGDSNTSECDKTRDKGDSKDSESEDDDFDVKMKNVMIKAMKRFPKDFMGLPKESFHLIKKLSDCTKMEPFNIMVTLRKIKLNESNELLGIYFSRTPRNIRSIFLKTLPVVAKSMKEQIFFPPREKVLKNVPIVFAKQHSSVHSIMNYFEVTIVKSIKSLDEPLKQLESRMTNTIRYLLSITPDGFINFLSGNYRQQTSDIVIFEDYLKSIPYHGTVLVDQRFKNILNLLERDGYTLLCLPSLNEDSNLSEHEISETHAITAVTAYIQRAFGRLRDFKMLSPQVDVDFRHTKVIDDSLVTACGLFNMQSKYMRSYKLTK